MIKTTIDLSKLSPINSICKNLCIDHLTAFETLIEALECDVDLMGKAEDTIREILIESEYYIENPEAGKALRKAL